MIPLTNGLGIKVGVKQRRRISSQLITYIRAITTRLPIISSRLWARSKLSSGHIEIVDIKRKELFFEVKGDDKRMDHRILLVVMYLVWNFVVIKVSESMIKDLGNLIFFYYKSLNITGIIFY